MGRIRYFARFIADQQIRMMILPVRDIGQSIHKGDRLIIVSELKGFLNFRARTCPSSKFFQHTIGVIRSKRLNPDLAGPAFFLRQIIHFHPSSYRRKAMLHIVYLMSLRRSLKAGSLASRSKAKRSDSVGRICAPASRIA